MDTVSLLNHYRLFVTRDPLRFRIFSDIFERGPVLDSELVSEEVPAHRLKKHILKLFRANLIQATADSKWTTSEFGRLVLARLGVARLSAEWLISSFGVPKQDEDFLKSCVRTVEDENWSFNLYRYSVLRIIRRCYSESPESDSSRFELLSTLYSAIVGLDPLAESLGAEGYIEQVCRRSSNAFNMSLTLDQLRKKVDSSLEDARQSNRLLLFSSAGVGKSAIALSYSRLLATVCHSMADYNLEQISNRTTENIGILWRIFDEWKPNVEIWSREVLRTECSHAYRDEFAPLDFVRTRMKLLLRRSSAGMPFAITANFDSLFEEDDRLKALLRAHHSHSELMGLLEKGVLDQLPEKARSELCDSMDELSANFRSRLFPSVTSEMPKSGKDGHR